MSRKAGEMGRSTMIEGLKSGDNEAWTICLKRYKRVFNSPAVALLATWNRNPTAAFKKQLVEEIVASARAELFEKQAKIRKTFFTGWLYNFVRNAGHHELDDEIGAMKDHIVESAERVKGRSGRDPLGPTREGQEDPADSAARQELKAFLRHVIYVDKNGVPESEREVAILAWDKGLTVRQIAKITGKTRHRVELELSIAAAKLYDRIKDEIPDLVPQMQVEMKHRVRQLRVDRGHLRGRTARPSDELSGAQEA